MQRAAAGDAVALQPAVRRLARLAIATGLFVFEIVRNWGNWQPRPG